MSETQSDHSEGPASGQGDPKEHPTGGLDPAPATPTKEKSDPEAGTASAHKHSPENADEPTNPESGQAGSAGGDITK